MSVAGKQTVYASVYAQYKQMNIQQSRRWVEEQNSVLGRNNSDRLSSVFLCGQLRTGFQCHAQGTKAKLSPASKIKKHNSSSRELYLHF